MKGIGIKGVGTRVQFVALTLLLACPRLEAQAGDVPGEEQPALPESLEVPSAPLLTPSQAAERFHLKGAASIELLAAEPLLVDPVVAEFDERGQIWVAEMRGYMPNIDGEGEREPTGVIAVLTDEDGDGRMDSRRVFLDGLVLPRAIHPAEGGCLVLAPPELALWRDTDGDGKADTKEIVDTGLGGLSNPEHAINGILYQPDNWYRVANSNKRYRRIEGVWRIGRTSGGGQWGLSQDHLGRAVFNTNPDPVRGDLFPSHYAVRNPNLGRGQGGNVRFAHDMQTWPARVNTGVNRGYQPATLRDDFTLRVFTAACAPLVRGNDVFVCEPAGNLVKRYTMDWMDGVQRSAIPTLEREEFLTSTDERFRPVNLKLCPDGSVMVVDFGRGLIQHRIFLTSWLRKQTIERGLDKPPGHGRLWRIRFEDRIQGASPPDLAGASWTGLVAALSHPNPWVRLTAQRLLVEEGRESRDAWELLREEALAGDEPLGRMHALWALEGTAGLDPDFVARALGDDSALVLHAALRVSEGWLAAGDPQLTERALGVASGGDAGLRLQVVHSLGQAATRAGDAALVRLATENCTSALTRNAIVSGLYQREIAFLERLLANPLWSEEDQGRPQLLSSLARCCVRQGIAGEVERLLSAALKAQPWQKSAIFEGVIAARPAGPLGKPVPTRMSAPLESAEALLQLSVDGAEEAYLALTWPGQPGYEGESIRPLSAEEQQGFQRGAEIYASICAACHQSSGLGEEGKAPPLRASPYVLGSPAVLGRILMQGLGGEIEFQGRSWNAQMPAFAASDEDLAAVMTYIRREWGNGAEPVNAKSIAELRALTADRGEAWTVNEIQALLKADSKGKTQQGD